jgi:hypothetical protein
MERALRRHSVTLLFALPIIYLIWVSVVIPLYPLCRWFAAVKQRHSDAWLSYF